MYKVINDHLYSCWWQGEVVYDVDGTSYYSAEETANALGLTVEEFKEVK